MVQGEFIFDVDIYAFLILCMLYFLLKHNGDSNTAESRAFGWMLLASMGGLIADYMSTRLVGTIPDAAIRATMLLTFMSSTVLMWTSSRWCCLQFTLSMHELRFWCWGIKVLCLLDIILLLLSTYSGWYCWFDAAGVYHRGPFFLLHVAIIMLGLLLVDVMIIYNHSFLKMKMMLSLLFYSVPVIVATGLSAVFPAHSFDMAGVAFAMLTMFITVQSRIAVQDETTGIYNRHSLEDHIDQQVKNCLPDMQFAVLTVNLGNLRQINADYGHAQGNAALRSMADLLKQCLPYGTFLARSGSHEFCAVLSDIQSSEELVQFMDTIRQQVKKLNSSPQARYPICLQLFCDLYATDMGLDTAAFLQQLECHL
jgi:diguanylate cyclase (GGDEF)-like protein